MSSLFQTLQAQASGAIDLIYGEAFIYRPHARSSDVNAPFSPDLDRPVVGGPGQPPFIAAFADEVARFHVGPARQMNVKPERPGHATSRPMISIDKLALPYSPKVGDRIERVATGVLYQVAELRLDDTVRFEADVNIIRNG